MIVLDSSFLIAWISERDGNHTAAASLMAEIRGGSWGRAMVPEYAFVETANYLHRKYGRARALGFVTSFSQAEDAEVVGCSPTFRRALELFGALRSPGPSFADAGIAAVAERLSAKNIATFDEGFRAWPHLKLIRGPRHAG